MRVSREQVLAYRIAEQGLHRDSDELELLHLGIQDTANATARLSLAARLPEPTSEPDGLTLLWSYRGAPHVHRTRDATAVATALWPASEVDALAKLKWSRSWLDTTGVPALDAFTLVAGEFCGQVTESMSKGAASAALTRRIPEGLSRWCRACRSTHIYEQLMRVTALPAGIRLERDYHPATLAPIGQWLEVPTRQSGVDRLVSTYLRFLGPATPKDVAAFLDTPVRELLQHWPQGLSEVDVEGRTAWLPEDRADALTSPPEPPRARLLPPPRPVPAGPQP